MPNLHWEMQIHGIQPGLCQRQSDAVERESYRDGTRLLDVHLQIILTIRCFEGVVMWHQEL